MCLPPCTYYAACACVSDCAGEPWQARVCTLRLREPVAPWRPSARRTSPGSGWSTRSRPPPCRPRSSASLAGSLKALTLEGRSRSRIRSASVQEAATSSIIYAPIAVCRTISAGYIPLTWVTVLCTLRGSTEYRHPDAMDGRRELVRRATRRGVKRVEGFREFRSCAVSKRDQRP